MGTTNHFQSFQQTFLAQDINEPNQSERLFPNRLWKQNALKSTQSEMLKGPVFRHFRGFQAKTNEKSFFLTFSRADNIASKFRTKISINFFH